MKFLTLEGKLKEVNVTRYSIKWAAKSPSKFQKSVKDFLKNYWFSQIVLEEFRIPGCLMRIDILNLTKRLAVEIDGEQHHSYNAFFHGNSKLKYASSIHNDFEKERWLEMNNFNIIRINPDDLPLSEEFFINLGVNL